MSRLVSVRVTSKTFVAFVMAATVAIVELAAQTPQNVPVPIAGRNINMVAGTTFPDGDAFQQRQNEGSVAMSTRGNHLLGAANDYRAVDIPGLVGEVIGDAWIGIFKSFDGGNTWTSTLLPGFRNDGSPQGLTSPIRGLEAGADPIVRAGTNGLFYVGGMAFNRETSADGKIFVARFIDNNNLEAGDSIAYLGTSIVDVGTTTRFLDKPWIAVDIPRGFSSGSGKGKDDKDKNNREKVNKKDKDKDDKDKNTGKPSFMGPTCQIPGQAKPIPAGNVYAMYSVFVNTATVTTFPPSGKDKKHRNKDGDKDRKDGDENDDDDDHDPDNHKPGVPVDGLTQVMFARSTDCGVTFSTPIKISERSQINQGSVAAIDPNTGTVYVAWREFLSSTQPDAILVTKSTDGGLSFSGPVRVSVINAFDQQGTTTRFRTNAYPAMAIDGSGRVYIAWAQRGVGPFGEARIIVTTSTDGRQWTIPVAAANHPGRGHQFMPSLSFAGGKLHLVFWDQRNDQSGAFDTYIDEMEILKTWQPGWQPGSAGEKRKKRHTLDLYGVAALPGNPPRFGNSVQLSQYAQGKTKNEPAIRQLQFNAPNLPLFALGSKPFIGDYIDVSVAPSFVPVGDGTWRFNTLSSDPSTYYTTSADNRDVRAPADGDWTSYTAPTFGVPPGTPHASTFDPSQLIMCTPGRAGMRNQNIYSSRVTTGLGASLLGNNKPLGFTTDSNGKQQLIQRAFVMTVNNPEAVRKQVALHIPLQPVGGVASFLQFRPLFDLLVTIEAKSTIAREVFVTSTDRHATVSVTVEDVSTHATVARVLINPDNTNPDIQNPDIQNPDIQNPDIQNAEAHAVIVSAPDIQNPDIQNLSTRNPDIQNPDIQNPDIQNPDIQNRDVAAAALADVSWGVTNAGNTSTSYQVKMLLDQAAQARLIAAGVKFQLVITKSTSAPVVLNECTPVVAKQNVTITNVVNPTFVDPADPKQFTNVVTPDIQNPDIQNTTVALAPGEQARVTLRVFSPVGDTGASTGGSGDATVFFSGALADLNKIGTVTTAHAVDTTDAQNGSTTPKIDASIPLIITTTLPDAVRTRPYSATIEAVGGKTPMSFFVVSGTLPPGLTLDRTGALLGSPTASGTFTFVVVGTDADGIDTPPVTLTIRVFEPLAVATTTLSGATVNQTYTTSLAAVGGFSSPTAPYVWMISSGFLPAGVSLSPAGGDSATYAQSGPFTFIATVTDAAFPPQVASASLTVNVTPTANAQAVTVSEDTPTPITLSANGAAAPAFTFSVGNQPAHGTVSVVGAIATYAPASNYNGADSFTFRAWQGSLSSAFATTAINVTASNDPPTALAQTVEINPVATGSFVNIVLTGTDPESSPLTFAIATQPSLGTLSGTAPNVRYTVRPGVTNGTDTFTFRVNDGSLPSAPATVTVILGPPPAGSADVSATLATTPAGQTQLALGSAIAYTAIVTNNAASPAPATGVTLTLAYPSGDLTLQQPIVVSQGVCTAAASINCVIGTLNAGASATVSFTLKATNRGGNIAATTAASASATPLDYNTTNNTATVATTITGPAVATTDLLVSQSRTPNAGAV